MQELIHKLEKQQILVMLRMEQLVGLDQLKYLVRFLPILRLELDQVARMIQVEQSEQLVQLEQLIQVEKLVRSVHLDILQLRLVEL